MNRKQFEQQIIERAWQDAAFYAALKANPADAIEAEFGVAVPSGVTVNVVEESAETQILILPASIDELEGELSDEDLNQVDGGNCWNTCEDTCARTCVEYTYVYI